MNERQFLLNNSFGLLSKGTCFMFIHRILKVECKKKTKKKHEKRSVNFNKLIICITKGIIERRKGIETGM